MAELSFAWPWMALLLPLPWLLRRRRPAHARAQALHMPGAPLERIVATTPGIELPPWWLLLAWVLLVVAVMRPYSAGEPVIIPADGRDLMLVVDISGSMTEEDVTWNGRITNRLRAVQGAAGAFLEGRVGDRIGLVLFGETAHLYTPLSRDTVSAADMLREVEVGLAGQKTAIGDALAVAVEHLLDASSADERVIVLLTDGENNAGRITPERAASLAAQSGMRLHTIGLDGEAIGRRGLFDSLNRRGVDGAQLQALADLGGGRSFIARGGDALAEVYAELDRIEPKAVADEVRLPDAHWYWVPLLGSLLLLLPGVWQRTAREPSS